MSRPWMPWYVADFVADTQHLSAAQTGAYMLLIGHYWQHGGLPDDDQKLARIARMRIEDWRRHRGTVEAFFQPGWRHARIDGELRRSEEISNKRKDAAKQKHSNSSANAPPNAEQLHTHARASSQPQSQKEDAAPAATRTLSVVPDIPPRSEAELEKSYFDRGKEILGKQSGGLLAKLLSSKQKNVALARAAIEQASTKADPREYIGAVIRGRQQGDETPKWNGIEGVL